MPILTKGQFATIAETKAGVRGLKGVVNEDRIFSKSGAATSVFLSHAHQDKDIVEQAKIFFENLGVSIYVDWADKTMPEKTDGVTALKIKHQIMVANDKFIVLATNNAVISKWCNGEIGIADPFKWPDKKMALLPLADNSGTWNGNEYLQIYPRIESGHSNPNDYYVWYPDGTLQNLPDWLRR